MRAWSYILIAIGVLALVTFAPLAIVASHAIEQRWMPALAFEATDIRVEGHRFYFSVRGEKYRDCPLKSISAIWNFDHGFENTAVYDAKTNEIFRLPPSSRAGTKFNLPLWTPVPEQAYNFNAVMFSFAAYNPCHSFYDLAEGFTVEVALPSPQESRVGVPAKIALLR